MSHMLGDKCLSKKLEESSDSDYGIRLSTFSHNVQLQDSFTSPKSCCAVCICGIMDMSCTEKFLLSFTFVIYSIVIWHICILSFIYLSSHVHIIIILPPENFLFS